MRSQRPACSTAAIALTGLVLCGACSAGQGSPTLVREFLFDRAPFPSCHASTVVDTPRGLIAAWFGGTHERHPDVGIWLSRLGPRGWDAPVEVATGQSDGDRYPTWNPVLFQPDGGPLLLFYKVGPTPRDWWGMVTESRDGGHSWTKAQRLPGDFLGPIKNKPIQLPGGDLLCPSSTEQAGWRSHFERVTPTLENWRSTGPVNDPTEFSAIQPALLMHPGGKLQALVRTRDRGICQVWSDDMGESWGPMTETGLPNPNSGIDAVMLRDGRALLVYNHSRPGEGRSPLNIAVSDDGRTWRAALVLENEQNHEAGYSYPAVIQAHDGIVHVTYTWRRERIAHVAIDPRAIGGDPIVSGVWPGSGDDVP